ncbi:uncharacterized protein B0H18DRAFT_51358 [Fomitopsis serialis]|uniref:uncharacterized protein n=1 Tax=Fomitopsis serialis TaxID=139415 RepID=UPI002008488E|nr:uncharacterized protein B0H18DRAFT_51358 [Neoantrodia serialis]KAH9932235.1 hypothetical protein B0H18DRAFT_51358 [Neoantrodia serialis]
MQWPRGKLGEGRSLPAWPSRSAVLARPSVKIISLAMTETVTLLSHSAVTRPSCGGYCGHWERRACAERVRAATRALSTRGRSHGVGQSRAWPRRRPTADSRRGADSQPGTNLGQSRSHGPTQSSRSTGHGLAEVQDGEPQAVSGFLGGIIDHRAASSDRVA